MKSWFMSRQGETRTQRAADRVGADILSLVCLASLFAMLSKDCSYRRMD